MCTSYFFFTFLVLIQKLPSCVATSNRKEKSERATDCAGFYLAVIELMVAVPYVAAITKSEQLESFDHQYLVDGMPHRTSMKKRRTMISVIVTMVSTWFELFGISMAMKLNLFHALVTTDGKPTSSRGYRKSL
jgi:hypothetical protein